MKTRGKNLLIIDPHFVYRNIKEEESCGWEKKVPVFPKRLFADFLAKKHVIPMFYQYCDYFFLHFYTLKPSLSHFKNVLVHKPCRLILFVLVILNEPRNPGPGSDT